MSAPVHRTARSQSGIALITALIFLVVITIVGMTMFKGFLLQERIARNTREKQRAFQAAQSTLKYAEKWLNRGDGSNPGTCNSLVNADTAPDSVVICSNALTNAQLTSIPWTVSGTTTDLGYNHTPPGMTVQSGPGGVNTYAVIPRFYISPLGLDPTGTQFLYQVSAMAQGASAASDVVVQSVYGVQSSVVDAGAP